MIVIAAAQRPAAEGKVSALLRADADVFHDFVFLALTGQGRYIDGRVDTVANGQLAGPVDELGHEPVIDLVFDDDAAGSGAALAGGPECPLNDAAHGLIHVGVGQDDDRVLAAHLGLDFLQPLGTFGVEFSPHLCGTGERDAFDVGTLDQRVAHLAARSGDQVQHSGRQAGFLKYLDQLHRAEGRCRRWLEDQCVAANERRGDLPGRDGQREVPGRDDSHDSQRAAHGIGHGVGQLGRGRIAEHAAPFAGGVLHDIHGPLDLTLGVADGLPLFNGDCFSHLGGPAAHDLQGLVDDGSPGRRRSVGPDGQAVFGGCHGAQGVIGAGGLEFADYLIGPGRVVNLIGTAGHRLDPLSADVILVGDYLRSRHGFFPPVVPVMSLVLNVMGWLSAARILQADANHLNLHRPHIGRSVIEAHTQNNVDASMDLGVAWYIEPVLQMVAPQVEVHVLGDAGLPIVNDDFVDRGVVPCPNADDHPFYPHLDAVNHGRGGQGKVEPGVLASRAFDADEWPGGADRGQPGGVFDLHINAVHPQSSLWHGFAPFGFRPWCQC